MLFGTAVNYSHVGLLTCKGHLKAFPKTSANLSPFANVLCIKTWKSIDMANTAVAKSRYGNTWLDYSERKYSIAILTELSHLYDEVGTAMIESSLFEHTLERWSSVYVAVSTQNLNQKLLFQMVRKKLIMKNAINNKGKANYINLPRFEE